MNERAKRRRSAAGDRPRRPVPSRLGSGRNAARRGERAPEVRDHDGGQVVVALQQQVLELEIAMHDAVLVHVLNSLQRPPDDDFRLRLGVALVLHLQNRVQDRAAVQKLRDDVHVLLLRLHVHGYQPQDRVVPQRSQRLDLAEDLFDAHDALVVRVVLVRRLLHHLLRRVHGDVDDLHRVVLPRALLAHALDDREPAGADDVQDVVLLERMALVVHAEVEFAHDAHRAEVRAVLAAQAPSRRRLALLGFLIDRFRAAKAAHDWEAPRRAGG
jgi:hypothetical protein